MTTPTRSRMAIYAVCLVLLMALVLFILVDPPKMSSDPQIRTLQKEAMELRIFQRAKELRINGKALFGWKWSYEGTTDYTENNVTFRGTNGYHEIEYENLLIMWRDIHYLKILYNGSKVYKAEMNFNEFWGSNLNLDEITAFVRGPWISVFDEMYDQAIKGPPPPPNGKAELKKNWGIG